MIRPQGAIFAPSSTSLRLCGLLLFACCGAVLLAGCGKRGAPIPPRERVLQRIDLEGFQLTDNPDGKGAPWAIPAGNSIAAHGWFLIWCDDDAGDGALHADFKLEGNGEQVALYDADGAVADQLTYDSKTADTSWARHPDGGDTWQESTPTPLAANP